MAIRIRDKNNKVIQTFKTREEAEAWSQKTYGKSLDESTDKYDPLLENTEQEQKKKSNPINRMSPLPWNWTKTIPPSYWSTNTHKNVNEGNTIGAIVGISPAAILGAGNYALPWLAENVAPYLTARGWLAATQAAGNTPAWLTPKVATAIDATLAGSGTATSIDDIRKNGPNFWNVLGTGIGVLGLAAEAAPTVLEGVQNFRGRFTSDGWFALGNRQYRPSMNTLSVGFPVIESRPAWQLQELPGFQIKSLFKGSPLERQLSKSGTLSLKQLQAYTGRNDVPAIDKELLNRVLQNHINDTHIDYNTLRQEVQGMIPKYTRVPQTEYSNYGMKRINIGVPERKKVNTFTFESPGIRGNTRHYQGNPIGHSRTYTTVEEPDILHVMESQSDWAQNPKGFHKRQNRINEIVNDFKNAQLNQNTLGFSEDRFNELYTKALNNLFNSNIKSRMINTYPIRQLQENLQYAAQQGQHKMRYPTPETAAKIEGYQKIKNNNTGVDFEIYDIEQEIQKLNQQQSQLLKEELNKIDLEVPSDKAIEMANNKVVNNSIQQRINQLKNQIKELKQSKYQYSPEHQTILKKYADFPKQFQKLFGKKAEVRTVTDSKGNTWYEVDVPESYLNGTAEMLFKKGGKLNPIEQFKRNRKYEKD